MISRASRTVARPARWSVAIATTATVAAMWRYPGGTFLDRATVGYSLSRNFLSDLGMTVAHDGRPNGLGAGLFIVGLLALVIGCGWSLAEFVGRLARIPRARPWARAAAFGALLACCAFAGVAVTPENRLLGMHIGFTLWGWRLVALLAWVLTVASFRAGAGYRAVSRICLFVAVAISGYTMLFVWGPALDTERGLMVAVVAQKIAAVLLVGSLLTLASAADGIAQRPVETP